MFPVYTYVFELPFSDIYFTGWLNCVELWLKLCTFDLALKIRTSMQYNKTTAVGFSYRVIRA